MKVFIINHKSQHWC